MFSRPKNNFLLNTKAQKLEINIGTARDAESQLARETKERTVLQTLLDPRAVYVNKPNRSCILNENIS